MTYRRDPHAWASLMTRAVGVLGRHRVAAALGLGESRVEQLCNPMRADWRCADVAVTVDNLLIEAGHGPVFVAEVHRRLAGHAPAGSSRLIAATVRAVVGTMRRALDELATVAGDPSQEAAA